MKQTETRVCRNCGPTDFQLQSRGYFACIACLAVAKRKYVESDPERTKRQKDEWYERNRADILADLKKEREENPEAVRERRAKHYVSRGEHIKNRVMTYKDALKLEIMSHYSGGKPQCKTCGIDDLTKLALDHVNDDGAKHRKEIGRGGNKIYLWVKRNKFPPIFQVLCHNCNQRKNTVCQPPSKRERSAYLRLRLKKEVMSHYSGDTIVCRTCGEHDVIVLTIDHVDGGGSKHRRSLNLKPGTQFYRWLKRNNFPDGFQVLCFNCNMSKEIRRL